MDRWKYICLILVGVCLYIEFTSTDEISYAASVLATAISSFPQIQKTWQDPNSIQYGTWSLFLFAAIFQFIPTTQWTIMERFYPMVLGGMVILILSIKFYREGLDIAVNE